MDPETSKTALRDHLANERTFLAWTRTALGWAALGLLVNRVDHHQRALLLPWLPSGFIAVSAFLFQLIGLWRYYKINRTILPNDGHNSITWAVLTTGLVGAAVFGLAALLHLF